MSTSPSSLKLAEALAGQAYREYPYDVYAQLREHPGWTAPSGYRVFSTYDDVLQILRQPAVFGQESVPYPNFHTVDPPEHTRLRRLVAKAFTVQSVNLLRDRIAEIVAGLVDDMQARGEADLISDFSLKLSATVTAELLRVPVSDAQMWNKWLWDIGRYRGVTSYFSIAQTDPGAVAAAEAASGHAAAYMRELVGTHRHIAEGGIVKRLLEAREEDETLSEKEVLYTLVLLLGAGLHTTASQLGNFFRALLTTPDAYEAVRADPDLAGNAVEESLRVDGSLQAEYRVAREVFEVHGVTLEPNEHIIIVNGAANHDPSVFDDPDTFDIHRPNARKHLTFGFGVHHCLGAELARTQLIEAARQLIGKLPRLGLARPLEQGGFDRWRGCSSLPIRWDSR
jgi:cytochrome P450